MILSSYALSRSDLPLYTWANSNEKLYPFKSWKEIDRFPSDILWRTSVVVGKIFSHVDLIPLFWISSKHLDCWLLSTSARVANLLEVNDRSHNCDRELIESTLVPSRSISFKHLIWVARVSILGYHFERESTRETWLIRLLIRRLQHTISISSSIISSFTRLFWDFLCIVLVSVESDYDIRQKLHEEVSKDSQSTIWRSRSATKDIQDSFLQHTICK